MPSGPELLKHLYDRFNVRDMEAVLATMHPDVVWANGMEGGHVYGHDGVRSYWTRQWALIDPHVEPTGFSAGADGVFNVLKVTRPFVISTANCCPTRRSAISF